MTTTATPLTPPRHPNPPAPTMPPPSMARPTPTATSKGLTRGVFGGAIVGVLAAIAVSAVIGLGLGIVEALDTGQPSAIFLGGAAFAMIGGVIGGPVGFVFGGMAGAILGPAKSSRTASWTGAGMAFAVGSPVVQIFAGDAASSDGDALRILVPVMLLAITGVGWLAGRFFAWLVL